jgi:hypothetical protein
MKGAFTMNIESAFGEVIHAPTRKQAVAEGFQVDVTATAQEAGIRFPVFLTCAAFETYVTDPPGFPCLD